MTAKLECVTGSLKGKQFTLDHDDFHIGRAESHLVLPEDVISQKHAVIRRDGDTYILEDCSKNGTYVNGNKISKQVLQDGDILQIHPYSFRFTNKAGDQEGTAVLERKTTVPESAPDGPAGPEPAPAGPAPVPSEEREKVPRARLIVYGILALGLAGLLIYSKAGKKDAGTAEEDPWAATTSARTITKTPVKQASPAKPLSKQKNVPDLFKTAESLYKDNTRAQNQYWAIKKWEEGFDILEATGLGQDTFAAQRRLYEQVKKALDETVSRLNTEAKVLVKQKDYASAMELLIRITDLIPDQTDPRHRDARVKIARFSN